MNKVILIGIIMAMNLAGTAFAADEMVTMDGKNILLTLVEPQGNIDGKLHSKDMPNGIYIRVSDSSFPPGGSELPNAGVLVKAIFVAHGFKVVDKAEDASVAIQFGSVGGSFNLVSANNQAEHGSIGADKVVGTIIVAAVGGGAGVLGAVGSLFIRTDERTSLIAVVSTKPVHKKPNVVMSADDNNSTGMILFKYRLEKDNKANDDTILKVMLERWINRYMVNDADATPISISPASAVVTAESLTKAK